jgi:hypothetical protein
LLEFAFEIFELFPGGCRAFVPDIDGVVWAFFEALVEVEFEGWGAFKA